MSDLKVKKDALRAEAKRARGLLSLNATEHDDLCSHFLKKIKIDKESVIAAYWPKERELDTHFLIDECLDLGAKIALPVIEKDSLILKFARYDNSSEMVVGVFGICHPVIDDNTEWLDPDIFIVPLLAFDRQGSRLGFGGGYYDATLAHYKKSKEITAIGLAYAQQACLFNLPVEEHDIKMDWIITEKSAQSF